MAEQLQTTAEILEAQRQQKIREESEEMRLKWKTTFLNIALLYTEQYHKDEAAAKAFFLKANVVLPCMATAFEVLVNEGEIDPLQNQDRDMMKKMWADIKTWGTGISQQRGEMILKTLLVINALTDVLPESKWIEIRAHREKHGIV